MVAGFRNRVDAPIAVTQDRNRGHASPAFPKLILQNFSRIAGKLTQPVGATDSAEAEPQHLQPGKL